MNIVVTIVLCSLLLTALPYVSAAASSFLTAIDTPSFLTYGAAGAEYFSIDNVSYMAVANFWDGVDPTMGAFSRVYEVIFDAADTISFRLVQQFLSHGAHGVDFFSINLHHEMFHLLVIPNYYACDRNQPTCISTKVYQWNRDTSMFIEAFGLPGAGASQTDHFTYLDFTYLVVVENFQSQMSVYKLLYSYDNKSRTIIQPKKIDLLPLSGAAACAISNINGDVYLVGASYYDNGWSTESIVYLFNPTNEKFMNYQKLATYGAHDAETIYYNGSYFLFFSEDRNQHTPLVSSKV